MNLNELEILEDDFDLFIALDDSNKIEFLFDALETGIEASVLKQIAKLDELYHQVPIKQKIRTEDYQVGDTRLSITYTGTEVHLNSNSLKAIRSFVNKMINDGILLWPASTKKSVFDMYRYFKAYKVIARATPISSN
jgi:hypothetical protein